SAIAPWNVRYHCTGDITAEQDPYFPISRSFEHWGRSFAALGIDYNGSELILDLLDRKGKHENGFMHGPVPAWRDRGTYRRARIQFTANAIPGMVGSGKRATETLFHEGGHAAHFANIDMPSPCFAQEFAPSSVAFAEVQSMLLDSLLSDADWQARYARTAEGEPMPTELIEKGVRTTQPSAALGLRMMFTVPYCERALYEIPDDELTPERAIAEIRATEQRLLGLDAGPRPALSIPHLISGEASAYYHGYVLALVAVHQTREFFKERDGHLMDNPRVGPDLCKFYWSPGNSKSFFEFIEDLTGKPLSADAIARAVNRTAAEALEEARADLRKLAEIPERTAPVALNANVRVMHGHEVVASIEKGDFRKASGDFAGWIDAYQRGRG
ncbi:MAG: M3 family metallopeptidase, partial [Planctomycetota bacterium]